MTLDADFGKKNRLFRWRSFWSWLVGKQAKLSHLGHRKAARIHWKVKAPKTSHCLLRILVPRHNWAIFLLKWARRGHYSQWRSLLGHVERIFELKSRRTQNESLFGAWFWSRGIIGPLVFENKQREAVTVNGNRYRTMLNEFLFTKSEEEDIGNIWFQQDDTTCQTAKATLNVLQYLFSTGRHYVSNSRRYTQCFAPCFWKSHYQPLSWCRLATSELRFDTAGLLFVGCRQARDNWRFKGQYS